MTSSGFLFKSEKRKDQSCKAVSAFALVFMYAFAVSLGFGLWAYTTLCKPSVFSISSITPSVATIIMVASAAMVGSK